MLKNNPRIFFSVIALVSAVSLFWLIAGAINSFFCSGADFQQSNPDSLLFMRVLEQSLLQSKVLTADNYACFPYTFEHILAPFYMHFLVYSTWAFYSIFPNCQIDPVSIAGLLPPFIYWLTGLCMIAVTYCVSKKQSLTLFVAFFSLPGISAAMTGAYLQLDYDYLISFLIWSWLLSYTLFLQSGAKALKLTGLAAASLLCATWLGSPLFFFLATVYGLFLWVAGDDKSASYLDFSAATMMIAGLINLYIAYMHPGDGALFSSVRYSFFQPTCLILGGGFFYLLSCFKNSGSGRLVPLGLFVLTGAGLALIFNDQIAQTAGLILKKDPIHSTIGELKTIFRLSELSVRSDAFLQIFEYLGITIFLFPLFFFVKPPDYKAFGMSFLRDWIVIMVLMTFYQVRYIRWIGAGMALYSGMSMYLLWHLIFNNAKQYSQPVWRLLMVFLPLFVLTGINNYSIISQPRALSQDQVEAFNWIQRNTPATSGYADSSVPEYGILSFWDQGNSLAYYTKRPAVVGNHMWGFKTKADVFAAETEQEAYEACLKYRIKYIYLTARRDDVKTYNLMNYLKTLEPGPAYKMVVDEIEPAENYKNWFYFYLMEKMGLFSLGNFGVTSHFRVVYAAKRDDDYMSNLLIFERVPAALVDLTADSGSEVVISLELRIGGKLFIYKKRFVADEKGIARLVLPYSTSHRGGRVETDPFYKLTISRDGTPVKAKLFISEEDVQDGRVVNLQSAFEVVE